eukprot:CAMPEP_0204057176 /NCGR_PEP_ID=MMETSP0360-20130528/133612_1 /ASSEMBLY_ACC=CAM_ASM_000342 /TAXON_ID=268821 /ORGANISM="Scrippsiella Hangoei, Strain SHTV-5" /LENGTH=143 /DNA_ID=CAMNT_0051004635 /DNA_START=32 /DNA_END=459 /DNA_ORIENTATION=+
MSPSMLALAPLCSGPSKTDFDFAGLPGVAAKAVAVLFSAAVGVRSRDRGSSFAASSQCAGPGVRAMGPPAGWVAALIGGHVVFDALVNLGEVRAFRRRGSQASLGDFRNGQRHGFVTDKGHTFVLLLAGFGPLALQREQAQTT